MNVTVNELSTLGTNIKVIGVGGAGGNAVAHMIKRGVEGVEFIAANTDAQALQRTGASKLIRLGETGLGAGANPSVGRECAISSRREITQALEGAHMVFITAGMGGGTGTGAASVVAEIAREMGILTVGVVTKPFEFEGNRRSKAAQGGIEELNKHVDSLIVVLNERLLEVLGEDITQLEAFAAADAVLYDATAGIAEIINKPGMINVDFQDVKTVMGERGRAMMGTGKATGAERARIAAEQAIACPLLEGVELKGARGVLVNITASPETLKMKEPREIMAVINQYVDEDAAIIYGAVYDESMGEELRVTVIATGLESGRQRAPQRGDDLGVAFERGDGPAVWRAGGARSVVQPSAKAAMAKVGSDRAAVPAAAEVEQKTSRYDIPAFLRKYSGGGGAAS